MTEYAAAALETRMLSVIVSKEWSVEQKKSKFSMLVNKVGDYSKMLDCNMKVKMLQKIVTTGLNTLLSNQSKQ